MKYLFINTVAGFGSTGRIAAEQCRALMEQGHSCTLAFGRSLGSCEGIPLVRIGTDLDCRLHGLRTRLLDDTGFGSKAATRRFLRWVRQYDPDVIWLHNLHGYYIHIGELFSYLRICGKQIHWTLHDCWAFTGHCVHFEFAGCQRWKTGCHHCPQKDTYPKSILRDGSSCNYARKKELFTGIPNLTLHVPSHWLERRVKDGFLGEYPTEVSCNQVDRSIFKPTASSFRQIHGLEDKIIVLGVSSVWYDRKGLGDFIALAELLEDPYKIVLIGLTPTQICALPKKILGLPRTDSAEALAQAYTAADVYVSPSVEETFGMTVLEACCCGTPAVVYQDTACEEVVAPFEGRAVPRGAENLRNAIEELTREEKA